jgi:hypothetical protein
MPYLYYGVNRNCVLNRQTRANDKLFLMCSSTKNCSKSRTWDGILPVGHIEILWIAAKTANLYDPAPSRPGGKMLNFGDEQQRS